MTRIGILMWAGFVSACGPAAPDTILFNGKITTLHTRVLEIATAEWVDWFNHRRPFEYCDDLTPVEAETAHNAHHQTPAHRGVVEAVGDVVGDAQRAERVDGEGDGVCERVVHAGPALHRAGGDLHAGHALTLAEGRKDA